MGFYYSVDDDEDRIAFPYRLPYGDLCTDLDSEKLAEVAADHYYHNCNGWEESWPAEIAIWRDTTSVVPLARVVVGVDLKPTFRATLEWERGEEFRDAEIYDTVRFITAAEVRASRPDSELFFAGSAVRDDDVVARLSSTTCSNVRDVLLNCSSPPDLAIWDEILAEASRYTVDKSMSNPAALEAVVKFAIARNALHYFLQRL
jgi:hypothetical protein